MDYSNFDGSIIFFNLNELLNQCPTNNADYNRGVANAPQNCQDSGGNDAILSQIYDHIHTPGARSSGQQPQAPQNDPNSPFPQTFCERVFQDMRVPKPQGRQDANYREKIKDTLKALTSLEQLVGLGDKLVLFIFMQNYTVAVIKGKTAGGDRTQQQNNPNEDSYLCCCCKCCCESKQNQLSNKISNMRDRLCLTAEDMTYLRDKILVLQAENAVLKRELERYCYLLQGTCPCLPAINQRIQRNGKPAKKPTCCQKFKNCLCSICFCCKKKNRRSKRKAESDTYSDDSDL